MTLEHRGKLRLLWHGTLGVLLFVTIYSGAGLLIGGADVVSSRTFEVLRAWPPGVRTLGALGLVLALAVGWAYGRGPHTLARVLPIGAAYHALWTLLIAAAYVTAGIVAWPALGNYLAMTALWVLVALTIPTYKPRRSAHPAVER